MKPWLIALILFAAPALAAAPASNGAFAEVPCAYPAAALTAKAQGATLMVYTGSHQGTVEAVKVVSSSGNADLDNAAVACVSGWQFDPASPLGKLLVGAQRLNIVWTIGPDGKGAGRRGAIPHTCPQYPVQAMVDRATGLARVRFLITAEGRVRDPSIVVSTGNADLDAATLECVTYWRYRPAIKNSKPVEVPWQAEVKWDLNAPAVPAD